VNLIRDYARELGQAAVRGWDRFWFTPSDPATLGLIRMLAGAMLLYTHLVWTIDLDAFFGPNAWLSVEAVEYFQNGPSEEELKALAASQEAGTQAADSAPAATGRAPRQPGVEEVLPAESVRQGDAPNPEFAAAEPPRRPFWSFVAPSFAWSYLKYVESPSVLWTLHIAALAVFALFMLGVGTRVTSILAFLITVAYVNRVPGALFGLDQINGMLALYLAIGPSGAAYSIDRLIARRRAGGALPVTPRIGANVAIRLIQLHMCVIYFFAGVGKLQGATWRGGTALWFSFANLEYQSLDMTWMADWPLTMNLLTHITVYWEVFFCVLVWPRLLRPIVLAVAVPLHLGIAFFMGMMTFGIVMLFGCLSFVPPWLVRRVIDRRPSKTEPTTVEATAPSAAEPATQSRKKKTPRRGTIHAL
jgi:hypothetical protein